MRAQRKVLAGRYVVHLPVDWGDVAPRFVGTRVATGQQVIISIVSPEWAKFEQRGAQLAHRNLASLMEVVQRPEPALFPPGSELPKNGSAVVAELVRGKSLHELLGHGPLNADRAVAWTIRLLEALSVLHQQDVWHGAISSAAVVAEPRARAIAPVLSRAFVPPLRDYASFERLLGSGPSISDDLWAIGVLLFEMLAGRRPFEASAVEAGKLDLTDEHLAFLIPTTHGAELAPVLRRALSSQSRRFLTTTEFIEALDRWERRLPAAPMPRETPGKTRTVPKGRGLAVWDCVVDDLSFSEKRVEATFDAAEHMRQTVVTGDSEAPRAPGRTGAKSERKSDPARPAEAAEQANNSLANPPAQVQTPGLVQKSSGPKSLRRFSSFGPEMAAFAERSRPKLKPWILAFTGIGVAVVLAFLTWTKFEERAKAVAVAKGSAAPGLTAPVTGQGSKLPKMSAREETSQCIRSYFRDDAVAPSAELEFVCREEDFLSVTRKLHEDSMTQFLGSTPVAPNLEALHRDGTAAALEKADAGSGVDVPVSAVGSNSAPQEPSATAPGRSTSPALVVRSGVTTRGWQLGWYELVATAIIRQNCCKEAAPIRLPETQGWCQQLQGVVRRIGADSAKVGDISPGVRTFDETINCLMAQGKHVTYPYKAIPTPLQKSAFQQFLKHAAEVDAKRASRR